MSYETILYATEGALATISLNRPHRLNSIVPPMPEEVEAAVLRANRDREVKVIVLRGIGIDRAEAREITRQKLEPLPRLAVFDPA